MLWRRPTTSPQRAAFLIGRASRRPAADPVVLATLVTTAGLLAEMDDKEMAS
jgi:hypothetical protein